MNPDFQNCKLDVSKHFRDKYMRKWDWDYSQLRSALIETYKIEKIGKNKYESYIRKDGGKKIIFVYYVEFETVFIISGSEGDIK